LTSKESPGECSASGCDDKFADEKKNGRDTQNGCCTSSIRDNKLRLFSLFKEAFAYLDSLTRGLAEIIAVHRSENISVLVNVLEYILKAPEATFTHADNGFDQLGVCFLALSF
jgi:hypothetical protein